MIKQSPTFESLDVPQGTLLIEYLGQAGYRIKGEGCHDSDRSIPQQLCGGKRHWRCSNTLAGLFRRRKSRKNCTGSILCLLRTIMQIIVIRSRLVPLVKANPGLKIICPPSAARTLQAAGIPSSFFITPSEGQWEQAGEVAYTAIPSAHYALEIDPVTRTNLFLGYVHQDQRCDALSRWGYHSLSRHARKIERGKH